MTIHKLSQVYIRISANIVRRKKKSDDVCNLERKKTNVRDTFNKIMLVMTRMLIRGIYRFGICKMLNGELIYISRRHAFSSLREIEMSRGSIACPVALL